MNHPKVAWCETEHALANNDCVDFDHDEGCAAVRCDRP